MLSKVALVRSAVSLSRTSLRCLSAKNEDTFKTRPYKLFKLDSGPTDEITITRDEALSYYRQMQVIRRLETTAGNLYKDQKVRGFCHLYTGQEAVAVGLAAAKHRDDAVITSYRCHGWTYLMGGTVAEILSELTGRISGNVYGKGGSMHMYERNFYGGNGIVGAQIALGAGIGMAMKYRNERNVSFTLYGDGAANQGQFFEAVNMAKLWDLPVIFICENNGFGMGTSAERASASTDYYTRGDFVPGLWVDGMDVVTVREAIRFAREYSIAKGPLVIEMATYRYVGHSMSDPVVTQHLKHLKPKFQAVLLLEMLTGDFHQNRWHYSKQFELDFRYRTREEVQEVRKHRDPITGFKDRIITAGLTNEDELKNIDKEVRKEVEEANNVALNEGVLPVEALYTDLFANTEPQVVRGCTVDETVVQPFTTTSELLTKMGRTPKSY